MSLMNEQFLEYLPDAQCGDVEARLHLWALGADTNFEPVPDNLSIAAAYRLRGWSVVPQLPGRKCPCIKWKPYQDRLPLVEELHEWWSSWPSAGIALVLGRISGVFAVDVDGEEAHRALVANLGKIPRGPKSLSGSRKPFRYHLLFKPPPFPTKAQYCPWHPKLEFRGDRGIIVVPPSRHKSGKCYEWAEGQSISEIELPDVPGPVLDALMTRSQRRRRRPGKKPAATKTIHFTTNEGLIRRTPNLARATADFLRGQYADAGHWNDRLFRAACDLAGSGVSEEVATPALLVGARPWDEQEREAALATIQSAYSMERTPSSEWVPAPRSYAGQSGTRVVSRPVPQIRCIRARTQER